MSQFKSDALQILSERGFINQCTDFEGLDAALKAGSITAYCGYDPTADSLHIGHLITIMMLYWLQQTGHKPITLMGGGTGLVGDPSFKDESRPMIDEQIIAMRIEGLKKAFGPVLRYGSGAKDAIMVNNADWLKGLGYIEFLRDYGSHFSVNRMLSFDSVKLRLEREQHLSFLEFNYMLMQAYDFVELHKRYGCTLQVSGADQWGNVVNGIELGRKKYGVTLYGWTAPLLTDASGKKMGKSEGNALWLNPELQTDYEYYQYWRNVDDGMVEKMLKLFTTLPMDEVQKLAALQGAEINEAKKILAFEATKLLRGEAAAKTAAETALQTFAGAGRSEGLPKITLGQDESLSVVDLLVKAGLCESKGEARRLIKGNGVRVNDQAVTDEAQQLGGADFATDNVAKLSAGKKRHILIIRG
jgi:tyrosyl-tRNA synthetase